VPPTGVVEHLACFLLFADVPGRARPPAESAGRVRSELLPWWRRQLLAERTGVEGRGSFRSLERPEGDEGAAADPSGQDAIQCGHSVLQGLRHFRRFGPTFLQVEPFGLLQIGCCLPGSGFLSSGLLALRTFLRLLERTEFLVTKALLPRTLALNLHPKVFLGHVHP